MRYVFENKLDKACFQHGMVYGDFKDLNRKQLLIKYYVIKHLMFLEVQNMMDIKVGLLQWSIIVLIKKLLAVVSK